MSGMVIVSVLGLHLSGMRSTGSGTSRPTVMSHTKSHSNGFSSLQPTRRLATKATMPQLTILMSLNRVLKVWRTALPSSSPVERSQAWKNAHKFKTNRLRLKRKRTRMSKIHIRPLGSNRQLSGVRFVNRNQWH